jgi:hypothetical protein
MNNREKLIDMMYAHSLERRDIAEIVLADRQVVDGWLAPPESARHAEVPDMAIELLRLKLAAMNADDEPSATPSGD